MCFVSTRLKWELCASCRPCEKRMVSLESNWVNILESNWVLGACLELLQAFTHVSKQSRLCLFIFIHFYFSFFIATTLSQTFPTWDSSKRIRNQSQNDLCERIRIKLIVIAHKMCFVFELVSSAIQFNQRLKEIFYVFFFHPSDKHRNLNEMLMLRKAPPHALRNHIFIFWCNSISINFYSSLEDTSVERGETDFSFSSPIHAAAPNRFLSISHEHISINKKYSHAHKTFSLFFFGERRRRKEGKRNL